MPSTVVIETPDAQDAPYSYVLSDAQVIRPESAFVHWDGTGASGPFLACMTFKARDGKVFSRTFPSTAIVAGGEADVSYAPFPGGIGQGRSTGSILVATANDNVTLPSAPLGTPTFVPWTPFAPNGIWDVSTPTNPRSKITGFLNISYIVSVNAATPMNPGARIFSQIQIPGPVGVFPGVIDVFGLQEATVALPAPLVSPSAAGLIFQGDKAVLALNNNDAGPINVSYQIRSTAIVF